jgi:FkbM family methyltransferase
MPFHLESGPGGPVAVFDLGPRVRITATEPEHLHVLEKVGEAVEEMAAFVETVGTLLFDVGAHTGAFSLVFCAAGAGRRAVAYEPSPQFAATVGELARLNESSDRLTVVEAAVGMEAGEQMGVLGSTGFIHLGGPPDLPGAVRIPIVSLDAESERLGIVPDLVKIDVEGYEFEVLSGAQRMLATARPIVFLELHLEILRRRKIPASRVCSLIADHGYEFSDLIGRKLATRRIGRSGNGLLRLIARPISY